MGQFSLPYEGYVAGLFGDDDDVRVGLFGDADGGPVAHAETGRDVGPVGDGEGAARGHDAVSGYDHRSVVERGVLEKQVHDEAPADRRVDLVAGADDVLEVVAVGEDHQGAGLVVGHGAAGFGDFVHGGGVKLGGTAAQDAVEEFAAAGAEFHLAADPEEEMADFGLEDDDEGEHADVHEGAEQGAHKLHTERIDDDHQDVDDEDGQEYVQRGGVADPPEHDEDDQGDQQDVQYVNQGHSQEAEEGKRHTPIINYRTKVAIIFGCRKNHKETVGKSLLPPDELKRQETLTRKQRP